MDQCWRFRSPSIELCPTCSISHFPFCRPPLPVGGFAGNDAVNIHQHPMNAIPSQFVHHPFQDPSFPNHPPLPRPWFPLHQWSGREDVGEREGFHKRMRLGDGSVENWGGVPMPPSRRLQEEDERRLNLIRSHGQQRPQNNGCGFGYPIEGSQFGNGINGSGGYYGGPGFDSFGRNGTVSEVPFRSCGGQEINFRKQLVDASNLNDFKELVAREKGGLLETEQNGSVHARFGSTNGDSGKRHRDQLDAGAQTSFNFGNSSFSGEASEKSDVSHLHLVAELLQKNFGWQPPNDLQQQRLHEEVYGYEDRHPLPPGRPSSSNIYQSQTSFVSPESEDYRQRELGTIYSARNSGENRHPLRLQHLPSENYSTVENSLILRLHDERERLPFPGVNNVPMGARLNYPLLPSHSQHLPSLPSPPSEPYPPHIQKTIIPLIRHQQPPKQNLEGHSPFLAKKSLPEMPRVVDASHIFKNPYRASRPGHIAIILRGLPGSGKSYLAKLLRDLEVENGGTAPRIYSMDDYFMIEVEKVDDADGPKSSTLIRGKKHAIKTVMEYCYEPEMEETYRASMLKAFKKTVEEGNFSFVIVDDRNLRVADFAQFWAIGKSSGYEVYLLEATYKDPTGCAARNVHGFTLDDIQKMAKKWEDSPSLYLQMDSQSLFRGDDLNEDSILEVDMDTEDTVYDEKDAFPAQNDAGLPVDNSSEELLKDGRWVGKDEPHFAKELRSSKWLKNSDEEIDGKNEAKNHSNALSGLIQAYSKSRKSVRWGDQVEKRGFSIGATKQPIFSLTIGPGPGYNLISNPLSEEASLHSVGKINASGTEKHSIFLEHLRVERESFKAVFERRRQRIGGLLGADDD